MGFTLQRSSSPLAGGLLTHVQAGTYTSLSRSPVEEMPHRDSERVAAGTPVSVASSTRDQWAWLDGLGRALNCGFLLVDPQGVPGPSLGASHTSEALRALVARPDSPLLAFVWKALDSDRAQREPMGALNVVCRRLNVQGRTAGALVLASSRDGVVQRPANLSRSSAAGAFASDATVPRKGGRYVREEGGAVRDGRGVAREDRGVEVERIEPWVTAAVEAHLGQKAPDESEEAFDRISSLHRLLHDGVEGGNEREVVTAFAEALFAWDGIEAIGYVEDVQGQWRRVMAPPGTTLPATVEPGVGQALRGKQSPRLSADDLARLGFSSDRDVVALTISDATPEPWLLLFSEGYRPLNLPRLNLYADLLREALARLSSIVETRAAWAILQTLLGATENIEPAVDAALREFARVVDGVAVSLIVTNATGTTLLAAGDRESIAAVRPFDRGNRLVSTAHLPDLGTMQLAVRRARGQCFTRREQHLIDRAATIFSAWLPGALKQPVETAGRGR